MRFIDVLIPPSLDARQALRLRRLGFGTLSYALATALTVLVWASGLLAASVALQVGAAYLALNLGLYAVMRSGLNLRFKDPSLTRLQVLSAMSILMYIVYHMDAGRHLILFGCFIVFLFGIFRFNTREFALITLYTLASYAVVIAALMQWRPQAIHDVALEWLSWLTLAGLLPCFAIIGGHINTLRRKLHESEVRFRHLSEMSSDFYWESDTEHRLMQRSWVDKDLRSESVFGLGSPIGKRRWELPYVSPDAAGWQAHRALLEARRGFRDFEFSRLAADGSERHVSISGEPVFDEEGAFQGYRGVGADITERKRLEQALRESAQQLRLFADNVPAMTASYDQNLRVVFANKRFADFFGVDAASVVGKDPRELIGAEAYGQIEGHFVKMLQGQATTYERVHTLASGEVRYLEVKLLPQVGELGKVLGCFSVVSDITERKLAEERVRHLAQHDSLTGLPNRLLFDDRLRQAISLAKRDARQFALLYLDLDRFKAVNDTLGHAVGDELLQAVSERIRRQVRESDTLARVGGDEFTVILPSITQRDEAGTVARKIIAAVGAPFHFSGQKQGVDIGASVGIAIYPTDARDAEALIKAADAAMYEAKQEGGSFRFSSAQAQPPA